MASCKGCLHVDVCKSKDIFGDMPVCPNFKDRTRFVELPTEIGNIVYIIPTATNHLKEITEAKCIGFSIGGVSNTANLIICGTSKSYFAGFDMFGKTVFLTREEAEKATEEQDSNVNK